MVDKLYTFGQKFKKNN